MILQYKGFNHNWVYEEAETIISAKVWVGKETRDYRKGGQRYENKYAELYRNCKNPESIDIEKVDSDYIEEMYKAVNRLIQKETGCSDEIIYHITEILSQIEYLTIVTLKDKNKYITYAFNNDVYLLNGKGQTVQKLA